MQFTGRLVFFLQILMVYSSNKKLCRLFDGTNDYTSGEWVLRNEHEHSQATTNGELFECCDPGSKFPICKQPHSPFVDDHGCVCRDVYISKVTDGHQVVEGEYRPEFSKYDWKPNNCDLTPWNANYSVKK
jgi:hypothetical protein